MIKDKISSPRRRDASRRNGALSQGPTSPEGKARSSRNAVTHGCLATILTFNPEDADLFNRILAEYAARFEPRDQVEHDLVEEIVRAKWQMREAWSYETSIIGLQIARDADAIARDWHSLGEKDSRALAVLASLKDSNTLPNLQRYARSLALQAERAIKSLLELKQHRLPPAEEPAEEPANCDERNEPSPNIEHLDSTACQPSASATPARPIHGYATTPAPPRLLATTLTAGFASPKTAAAGA